MSRLKTPTNKPVGPYSRAKPAPIVEQSEMMRRAPYDGKELKRNPGIDDSRFEAFNLPSRMGDQLIYPKRRA